MSLAIAAGRHVSNEWVREALEARGHKQRDLAQAWGISEAGVSRWMRGLEQQDLPMSRVWILSRMLGLETDEVITRLGFGGDASRLPPPSLPVSGIELGTSRFDIINGRARILLHLDVDPDTARRVLTALTRASLDD